MDGCLGGGRGIGADDDGGVWGFLEECGNYGADSVLADFAAALPDAGFCGDGDEDGLAVEISGRSGAGFGNFYSGFLYENGGDDEEDEEEKDDIDEWGDVDGSGGFGAGGVAVSPHVFEVPSAE